MHMLWFPKNVELRAHCDILIIIFSYQFWILASTNSRNFQKQTGGIDTIFWAWQKIRCIRYMVHRFMQYTIPTDFRLGIINHFKTRFFHDVECRLHDFHDLLFAENTPKNRFVFDKGWLDHF